MVHANDFFFLGFKKEKVPENLDAIVIGSGIGGMTAAATLAKLGKRVLVLEQHDQAGGCCHTYSEKGFEFDIGKKSCYYILASFPVLPWEATSCLMTLSEIK